MRNVEDLFIAEFLEKGVLHIKAYSGD